MPPKGHKKSDGGRSRPRANLTLSQQCQDLLDRIATDEQLINPRTGTPNKSQAVEVAALAYRLFRRTYPDNLPYPQSLLHILFQLVPYLEAKGDAGEMVVQIHQHIDYLESWGADVALDEMIGEGVIKTKDGWIV
ncbi:hypothetical protein [Nostoc sp.]